MADSTTVLHARISTAYSAPVAKTFKRRATVSCSFCQWRKIRCNVEERSPCDNCAAENIDCRVTKRRKTKKDRTVADRIPPTREAPVEHEPAGLTLENHIVDQRQQMSAVGLEVLFKRSLSSPDDIRKTISEGETLHQGNARQQASSRPPSLHSGQSSSGMTDKSFNTAAANPTVPSYMDPIPSHLSTDDIEYLHRKGSFDIPGDKFRDALVQSYVQFVHPFIPFLDIDEFLSDIMNLNGGGRKVSLLVFQAVLFTGSAHVDIKPLRMMGFLTRKAARKALYLRTKALYDLGYEQNRLHVIQALVLMTLWSQSPDDQQDAWHWLQIAISLARRACLDQDPTSMNIPESEKRLRKRLWWCCLIRDPLLALGLKRPISISAEDYDVPELSVHDWDIENSKHEGLTKFGLDWDYPKVRLLRITCITEARLHRCLSNILAKQYTLRDYHRDHVAIDQNATRAILLPITTDAARISMGDCEEGLRLWLETLPRELASTVISPDTLDTDFDAFVVFRNVLHMVYHTCIITLYRPWIRPSSSSHGQCLAPHYQYFQDRIQGAVRTSAQRITELAVELHRADLARHLPQTALSAMVAATVIHISDVASGDESLRDSALQHFEQCSHVLNELREHYYSADFTSDFVNLIAKAKKLPKRRANTEPVADGTSQAVDFHDQSYAQKTFLAERTPEAQPLTRQRIRCLPEALFPQGTDLSSNPLIGEGSDSDWNFKSFDTPLDNRRSSRSPANTAADGEYYHNFRDECAGLVGDFFDDYVDLGE